MYIYNAVYSIWFYSVWLAERLALHTEHVNSNDYKGIYTGAKVFALPFLCFKNRSNLAKQGPVGSSRGRSPLLPAHNE